MTVSYRNFEIEILQEDFPINPFTDIYELPDLYVYSDRSLAAYIDGNVEYGPKLAVPELTREQIFNNLDKIKFLFGYKNVSLLYFLRCVGFYDGYSNVVDAVNALLEASQQEQSKSSCLGHYADILSFAGIVSYQTTSTGYSQGCWADLLVVASPEFLTRIGRESVSEENLKDTADLYGYWAWGDVYGYTIDEINESSWGFYGDDHEESGLLEAAKNVIDSHIEYEAKKFREKLKQLIKHRVPLHLRKDLLA